MIGDLDNTTECVRHDSEVYLNTTLGNQGEQGIPGSQGLIGQPGGDGAKGNMDRKSLIYFVFIIFTKGKG